MGYTTDFHGQFNLDKALTDEQKQTLEDFADERHGGNTQPHEGFPGFWCQWRPGYDGKSIEWDGGEKFYDYVEWLEYIIKKFIQPWGLTMNGQVEWRGEDPDDMGLIVVEDNVVTTKVGRVTYEE